MRRILFLTGSRGEYGYIRPILKRISKGAELQAYVVATNMHLLPEFGASIDEFKRDNIVVHERPLMALAGYTRESMAKSLGIFQMAVVDILSRENPDFVLLAGDRGEQLMGAIAASHMYIPVAHIQGGELSGNIDGMTRHAITKFAHIHFASNQDAAERLYRMGEEPFRVHVVGAPQLDELMEQLVLSREEVRARFNSEDGKPLLLILQHPVTEQYVLSGEQMRVTLETVAKLGYNAVVIFPNNDAGSIPIQRAIEEVRSPRFHVERNLPRNLFSSLLAGADVIVGNSSAGLLEAPTFELPAVNIGTRQRGRLQGANVINVGHDRDEIAAAIRRAVSPEFRMSLKAKPNPYGDGRSSQRVIKILSETPVDERLLVKRMTY
jgi:UDP-hydrolysing UDP-N-acetyl-D-glucosamine 2-epimerase